MKIEIETIFGSESVRAACRQRDKKQDSDKDKQARGCHPTLCTRLMNNHSAKRLDQNHRTAMIWYISTYIDYTEGNPDIWEQGNMCCSAG